MTWLKKKIDELNYQFWAAKVNVAIKVSLRFQLYCIQDRDLIAHEEYNQLLIT